MSIISLQNVWLKYRIEFKENEKISKEDFWALKGINLDINKGETIGIIGENGAGKTSLLKIVAGMLKPDRGFVQVRGKVSTIMEINAGFQRDLTGKENVHLISSFFGLTREQIDMRYNDVVKLASIGRFINAPVKTYSQGMYMRLAFAIAIHVEPDILLIDDMFTVGDVYAQLKCINKMFELKEKGMTILTITQDLEMAKKLCSRAIFLKDGEVIKDGLVTKICSYYMETVGDKKGIAILQEGSLGIIFNNGRLILRWKDRTITCNLSGFSTITASGRRYISNTADWEIRETKTKKEIVAIGSWPDNRVIQYWNINLLNEEEFLWEITLYIPKDTFIEGFRTTVMFIDEYLSWFTFDSNTKFPEVFINIREWDCVNIDTPFDKIIGLSPDNKIPNSLPKIIFDRSQDDLKMMCQIGNTGAEIKGRVIVYDFSLNDLDVNFSSETNRRYFFNKVRIIKNGEEKYLNHAKQIIDESMEIHKGSIKLLFKDTKVEIYWQDKLLTRRVGLNTKFIYCDKDYSTEDGRWNIYKANDQEVVINISWGKILPFTQRWRLKLEDDNTIIWEIILDISEKVKIRNKQVKLLLSDEYEKWVTTAENGDFKNLENKGNSVILNNYVNKYMAAEGVYRINDLSLPDIVFNCEDLAPRLSYIYKIKDGICAKEFRFVEIDSKENLYTLPGEYRYFKSKIRIFPDSREKSDLINMLAGEYIANKNTESLYKIESNGIALILDHGKGRIFWEGIELTKGLGLYSSILSVGKWIDSGQAFWKIQKLEKERLIAVCNWSWIPITQIWEISILNGQTILWKIIEEAWENVISEKKQINLMLSDRYREWFVHRKFHGKFPSSFIEHNGIFWDRLWYGDIVSPIGVKECKFKSLRQLLPSIFFDCSADCQARNFVIENTDNLFQARILQCELNPDTKNGSSKNKYFEGQIRLITQ